MVIANNERLIRDCIATEIVEPIAPFRLVARVSRITMYHFFRGKFSRRNISSARVLMSNIPESNIRPDTMYRTYSRLCEYLPPFSRNRSICIDVVLVRNA